MPVGDDVARKLCELNTRFYAEVAESFSATRRSSWAGWDKALNAAGVVAAPHRVVDVACGNMRFAAYLADRFVDAAHDIDYLGIDNCLSFAANTESGDLACHPERRFEGLKLGGLPVTTFGAQIHTRFIYCDLASTLIEERSLDLPGGDLVVCSGFMHHVPGFSRRRALLEALFRAVKLGGVLIVSFWQFMSVESIAKQAIALTDPTLRQLGIEPDQLEAGDYILGWQNSPTVRRYCHGFTAEEVRMLATAACESTGSVFDLRFFEADGRNRRLNSYLVAKRLA